MFYVNMKWNFLWVLFFYCVWIVGAADDNYVYSYAMATHCKEHISQKGYTYDQFYSLNSEDYKTKLSKNGALEMHIAIQAVSNGHILLSTVPFPSQNDSVYEIVVGGGGNKFTELRRNLKRNAKASLATIGILSAVQLRGFYIKISTAGLVEFGKEGADLPILSYMDIDPLDIRYLSFAAWNGVEAKFLYDCPSASESTNQTLPNSKVIERKLSNSDRLKAELLQDRPAHLSPGPIAEVGLEIFISALSYNAFDAKLTTRMSILTTWIDESLAWNPEKFNNITSLTLRQGQIWRPMFHVFNSDNLDPLRTTGHEVIKIVSTGEATFHFKAVVDTWCFTESTGYNRWPHDKYDCSIVIQPSEAHEKIILKSLDENAPILEQFTDTDDITMNEWTVIDWTQAFIGHEIWNSVYTSNNNETYQSDRLCIKIRLQREAAIYNIVFYTPLLVLMVFVLMSFWSDPLQMARVWFYAGTSIVICMGLSYIDYLVPCHTVPSILVLYMTVLGGVLLAMLLQVLMMTSAMERLCKTHPMQTVLSAKIFRTLFCLPVFKVCRNYNNLNESFAAQVEDDPGEILGTSNGDIEEMQRENTKYCEKDEIAEAVDKTLFFVYSLVFAIMLGLHY